MFMIFPPQNSKLVYSFKPLSCKPMQDTRAMYLTVLVPPHAIKGCFKRGLGSNAHIHGAFHIHG